MTGRILRDVRTRSECEVRLVEYAPGTCQPPHVHDRDSITLVLRGDLIESSERGEEHAAELSVVAKPAGLEHENRFGSSGAHTLQIELPRDHRRLTAATVPRAYARWEHVGPACRALLQLLPLLNHATLQTGCRDAEKLLDRTLAGISFPAVSRTPPPPWLAEVRLALEHEATPIATLARRSGLHPVYLARRFRAQFGMSAAAYRARLRVRRAARALLEAEAPLATVALDAGYYDQPHMNRQIRALTGLTPRALRGVSVGLGIPAARGVA